MGNRSRCSTSGRPPAAPPPPPTRCPLAWAQERELKLFTREEHVNTLAPTVDDRLWAVLHNMGQVCGEGGGRCEGRCLGGEGGCRGTALPAVGKDGFGLGYALPLSFKLYIVYATQCVQHSSTHFHLLSAPLYACMHLRTPTCTRHHVHAHTHAHLHTHSPPVPHAEALLAY